MKKTANHLLASLLLTCLAVLCTACQQTQANPFFPAEAAEENRHWTDAQSANAIIINLGDIARLARVQASPEGDLTPELGALVNDDANDAGGDAPQSPGGAGGYGSLVVILRDNTFQVWVDTASSAKRDGSGGTASGGDVGPVTQSPTQNNNPDVSLPIAP